MDSTTTCTYGYQLVVGTVDSYPVVASSTCTGISTSTATIQTVQYGDWLFATAIIVFLLAFFPISAIFNLFKKR